MTKLVTSAVMIKPNYASSATEDVVSAENFGSQLTEHCIYWWLVQLPQDSLFLLVDALRLMVTTDQLFLHCCFSCNCVSTVFIALLYLQSVHGGGGERACMCLLSPVMRIHNYSCVSVEVVC